MQQQSLFQTDQPLPIGQTNKDIVILLDLNYTLVSNSNLKMHQRGTYASKIESEEYRQWLVELVRGHTVCLCTVRHVGYETQTLAHIEALTGWKPEHSFFNPVVGLWHGDKVKEPYLRDSIFPMFGMPSECNYFGIESATATRGMYKRNGILSLPVPKNGAQWERLPFPPEWE